MTVYVDDMHQFPIGQFGRMKMSHMGADSTQELLEMADRIGVQRKWIQKPGTPHEHFDVAKSARAKAVSAGAVEITMREMALFDDHRLSEPHFHNKDGFHKDCPTCMRAVP